MVRRHFISRHVGGFQMPLNQFATHVGGFQMPLNQFATLLSKDDHISFDPTIAIAVRLQ